MTPVDLQCEFILFDKFNFKRRIWMLNSVSGLCVFVWLGGGGGGKTPKRKDMVRKGEISGFYNCKCAG